ncbi:unnamed protein product [Pleuronectes platessa]|uniref:Uncharacterized protein n=1 Tax=Pleuronectes platessa TaxID=8262 RepID=A0A9N7V8P6_PLEPL|nr:unnamed protein product [Pleuronectes platessa]
MKLQLRETFSLSPGNKVSESDPLLGPPRSSRPGAPTAGGQRTRARAREVGLARCEAPLDGSLTHGFLWLEPRWKRRTRPVLWGCDRGSSLSVEAENRN